MVAGVRTSFTLFVSSHRARASGGDDGEAREVAQPSASASFEIVAVRSAIRDDSLCIRGSSNFARILSLVGMATAIRSTGCCAIANSVSLRQAQNSVKQDNWERASSAGCATGAMLAPSASGLTSDLFCSKTSLMPKNWSRPNFRFGRVSPIRSKMFVPGFGEASPEAQAAAALHNFFTYVAVKIVASQLEDYNKEAYGDLMGFLEKVPLKDGDKFIAELMRESFRHKNLALRIMEVRSAYAKQDFEWDNLQDLSGKQIEKANTALMRKFLTETSNME